MSSHQTNEQTYKQTNTQCNKQYYYFDSSNNARVAVQYQISRGIEENCHNLFYRGRKIFRLLYAKNITSHGD